MWTPQQRLEIGEHATKNGNASTLRLSNSKFQYFDSKYLCLTKQSIAEFKKAYNEGKQKGVRFQQDLNLLLVVHTRGMFVTLIYKLILFDT